MYTCLAVHLFFFHSGRATPTETKSEKSSLTQMTGFSSGTQGTALASKRGADSKSRDKTMESFVSLQLEKVHIS